MKYKEIEFKYNADNIPLFKFVKVCEEMNPVRNFYAAGYDHFYEKADEKDAFCRHRCGVDINQLTFKRKTVDKNNFIRTEHNIDLAKTVDRAAIEALVKEFGYTYNSSIFKTCVIFQFEYYTLVYYVVSDGNFDQRGKFIEIEMAEDHNWANEEEAWNQLILIEKLLKTNLGITPQSRLKSSLFELYKKAT